MWRGILDVMNNVGAYPVDPSTPVGNFRLLAGDAIGDPIEPTPPETVPTSAVYKFWSDTDIQAFLDYNGDNMAGAIAQGFSVLIANARLETIRTDDLTVKDDTVRLWETLLEFWGEKATKYAESFVEFYPTNDRNFIAEGSWGRVGEGVHWGEYYRGS